MAEHRHKRETHARRFPPAALVAAPLAVLATAATVTSGIVAAAPAEPPSATVATTAAFETLTDAADRTAQLSRSGSRSGTSQVRGIVRFQKKAYEARLADERRDDKSRLVRRAEKRGDKRWTTTTLDIWSSGADKARDLGELEEGTAVLLTGRERNGRVEVVIDGQPRWVTAGYLSDEKPIAAAAGLSMQPCPDGSVESGLTSRAVYVYRSVCHAFPQITSYGGWDNHGEHASGRALDIMTSDVALGTAIADFLRAHAVELNLYDVIWRQRIWTQERGGEGWRMMPSRGSATANHYDHVHVAVY